TAAAPPAPPGFGPAGGGFGGGGRGGPGGPAAKGAAAADGVELRAYRFAAGDAEKAAQMGRQLNERMEMGSVRGMATASQLGDYFQYLIDQPVNLARQKSALLPIVNKDVEGTKVSIYNQAVQ